MPKAQYSLITRAGFYLTGYKDKLVEFSNNEDKIKILESKQHAETLSIDLKKRLNLTTSVVEV